MPSTDPLNGTWRFNAARSTLTTPAPQRWIQEIVAGPTELNVTETFTTTGGDETVLTVRAAFDGKGYAVEGSALVETMAYTRPDPNTILATGWRGDEVVLTETVTVDAASATFTQRYQVHRGANVVAAGVAVFEKD
jgi:hypothetical protein